MISRLLMHKSGEPKGSCAPEIAADTFRHFELSYKVQLTGHPDVFGSPVQQASATLLML